MYGLLKSGFFQFALPDNDNVPAFGLKLTPDFLVALLVPCDLRFPELGVRLGHRIELAAPVAMPETAVDEDDRAVLWKDDVWLARQFLVIHPIAENSAPEGVTKLQLRFCRSGVDGRHVAMALVWSEYVWHVVQSYIFSSVSTKWPILTNCQQNSLSLPSY